MPRYTPEEIEELIEANLRKYFGDSLSPQQRTVAADIIREVYFSVADRKIPLARWQARVSELEQQWQLLVKLQPIKRLANFAQLYLQWTAARAMQNIFQQSPEEYYTARCSVRCPNSNGRD
ncbi:MAG: hypothetical protein R3E08_12005 [Thiotrichaceae bacterium]